MAQLVLSEGGGKAPFDIYVFYVLKPFFWVNSPTMVASEFFNWKVFHENASRCHVIQTCSQFNP